MSSQNQRRRRRPSWLHAFAVVPGKLDKLVKLSSKKSNRISYTQVTHFSHYIFIARMRGFLFVLSVVSTIHRNGSTSDLFQAEEDIHAGLDITYTCANT